MYCLVLAENAKVILHSHKYVWRGESMTQLVTDAVGGEENYNRCIGAQDPLSGGRSEGQLMYTLNPNAKPMYHQFALLGIIFDEDKVKL